MATLQNIVKDPVSTSGDPEDIRITSEFPFRLCFYICHLHINLMGVCLINSFTERSIFGTDSRWLTTWPYDPNQRSNA